MFYDTEWIRLLGMFFDKLPRPLNEEISEKYQEWKEKYMARDALGNRIAFLRKWIDKKMQRSSRNSANEETIPHLLGFPK